MSWSGHNLPFAARVQFRTGRRSMVAPPLMELCLKVVDEVSTGITFEPATRLNRPSPACDCAPPRHAVAYREPGILSLVFKLAKSAEQRWLKLRGPERIAEVIRGIQFKNGVREDLKKIAA